MSSYWNFVTTMVPATLAKAEDVNTNLSGIDNGFNLVEAEINKAIQITNSPGITDVTLNAAARANKLLSFDTNGDLTTTVIMGDWRGDHADAAGTDYEIRDVVKDAAGSLGQDNIYICNTTHTSTGSLTTDTAKWDLLVDVAGVAVSAAAALVSENNAATSADFLDDRMLGAFSTANEPTLDNDGNALLTGAQYFNTDLNFMKNYTGSIWQLNTANAVDVVNVAAGNIVAVNVQAAINELDTEKAALASPSLTGTPLAPTAALGTNTTQLATTAFVQAAKPFRGALVYLDASVSVNHATIYDAAFDQEDYDTDSIHDNVTNNTRLTVPAGVTKVRLTSKTSWASNTTGIRLMQIRKNASNAYVGFVSSRENATASSGSERTMTSAVLTVEGGDYFELRTYQDSGGALNLTGDADGALTWFGMEIIE